MKLKFSNNGLFLASFLAVFCCSVAWAVDINTEYDSKADFSQYKTYNWLPGGKIFTGIPELDEGNRFDTVIREAVEKQLAEKGLQKADLNQADLLITYRVGIQGKVDVIEIDNQYFGAGYPADYSRGINAVMGPLGSGRPYGMDPKQTMTRTYAEGSLVLDFSDPETKQLLWRSSAKAEVKKGVKLEEREKRINNAVRDMLKKYPPKK